METCGLLPGEDYLFTGFSNSIKNQWRVMQEKGYFWIEASVGYWDKM